MIYGPLWTPIVEAVLIDENKLNFRLKKINQKIQVTIFQLGIKFIRES